MNWDDITFHTNTRVDMQERIFNFELKTPKITGLVMEIGSSKSLKLACGGAVGLGDSDEIYN